jgi:hypothetical protein
MLFNSPGPDAQEPEVILDSHQNETFAPLYKYFHEHFPILDGVARISPRS